MRNFKVRYCVAGLPINSDSYAYVNEAQDYESLLDIQQELGDDSIKQAVFDTSSGERCPLFVSWSREMGKRFYRVLSVQDRELNK